ncbi:hypothetical protein ACTXT7_011346 [Hymenolepis weldensis]
MTHLREKDFTDKHIIFDYTLKRSDIQGHPLVIQAQVQDQIPLALIIPHLLLLHPRHRRPTAIQLATAGLKVGSQSTIL